MASVRLQLFQDEGVAVLQCSVDFHEQDGLASAATPVQQELCGTNLSGNIVKLRVSCYNDRVSCALFVKHPRAQGEWLRCFARVLTPSIALSPQYDGAPSRFNKVVVVIVSIPRTLLRCGPLWMGDSLCLSWDSLCLLCAWTTPCHYKRTNVPMKSMKKFMHVWRTNIDKVGNVFRWGFSSWQT